MSKIILSMDAGKHHGKCSGINVEEDGLNTREYKIRSKFYDLINGNIELADNNYKVELDGKSYIVGEQGTEESITSTNKATLLHKLCVYSLITEYIKPDTKDNEVYMVLSCPLNLLSSVELKEEYKDFIANNNKEINVVVNEKKYTFTIKAITIKSEGSGVYYLNKEKFKGKDYLLVDIGGLNMQVCLYRNGIAQVEERFTEMTGSKKLIRDIKKALELHTKGNAVTLNDAQKALEDKIYIKDQKTKNIIKNVITEYIEKDVIKTIGENLTIDINTVIPLFIGGTVMDIKEEIQEVLDFKAEIQDDAQFASVKGLFKIAYAKYN